MDDGRRREAIEAAREAIEDRERRDDVQAIRIFRLLEDLRDLAEAIEGRIDGWPHAPGSTEALGDRLRSEIDDLEGRLEERVRSAAPNLASLLGPNLAAAMLAEAGDLDELARMPTSRVQVLGAKEAVLRAKEGADPPKHGVLFLHPVVGGAPPDRRGDQAKALARLVVTAARADAFTGRDAREELAEALAELEP